MNMSRILCAGKAIASPCFLVPLLFTSAFGQRYEITPLVGARYGGTMELEQASAPNVDAHVADSVSFGLAGGFRLNGPDDDGYDVIEFRWMRQNTHLSLKQDPLVPASSTGNSFRPSISLDHFLADFTHEFTIKEASSIQPFLTGSLGAARMSAPASSSTRFAFGIGAGVKIFRTTHWGFRFKVEYLPTVMHGELQRLVCAGGCIVVLSGGLMNQFEVSFGPAFRF